MAGTTIPNVPPQFFDDNGNVAAGYSLYTYEAGTTTNLATYSDVALSVANANPIVLDSAGRATIFLQNASYKFVLKDTTGSTVWTRDNIVSIATYDAALDVTGTAGEALSAGEVVYCSDGSGSLTAGRWYLADADNTYSSNKIPAIGFATEAAAAGAATSIRLRGKVTGLSGLTAGTTYYVSATAGALTSTQPTNSRVVAIADSTTSVVIVPVEGADDTTGPLPAINGNALTGLQKYNTSKLTATGNVGTGEDVLEKETVAAGTLATNGDFVRGVYWGVNANNANAKNLQVSLKEGANDTVCLNINMATSEATRWRLEFTFLRDAATTFHSSVSWIGGPANTATTDERHNNTTGNTITWANAVDIEITGTATANDDIQLLGGVLWTSTQA